MVKNSTNSISFCASGGIGQEKDHGLHEYRDKHIINTLAYQVHSKEQKDTDTRTEVSHGEEQELITKSLMQTTNPEACYLVSVTDKESTTESRIGQPIEPLVSNGDTAVFRGVVRKRTKRIVLYNVRADKPFELVSGAVKTYAENKDVKITFSKLLKKRDIRGKSTYIMRVNILESDFENVEQDENFWPAGVYWRDYIPYNSSNNYNEQTEQLWI